jgi:hypothetical protein
MLPYKGSKISEQHAVYIRSEKSADGSIQKLQKIPQEQQS